VVLNIKKIVYYQMTQEKISFIYLFINERKDMKKMRTEIMNCLISF